MVEEKLTLEQLREARANLQSVVNSLQSVAGGSRERTLAITKLQESKMWLGQVMWIVGGEDLNAERDKSITNAATGNTAE